MTELELITAISEITTAISNGLKTGFKYEFGSGASKRVFEQATLKDLMEYRRQLQSELANILNSGGGVMVGF